MNLLSSKWMHFGFVLEFSDINLWNIDFLDTHLDLLSPDNVQISPVSILFVSIISSRRLQDIFSRCLKETSSRCLQNMSSRRLQDMSWRCLQDVFSETIFRLPRRLKDVFARCVQDALEDVKLLRWRRVYGRIYNSNNQTAWLW